MESEARAVDQESLNEFPAFILGFCISVAFIVWCLVVNTYIEILLFQLWKYLLSTRFVSCPNNLTHFVILRSIWRVADQKLFEACNSLEMLFRNFLGFCLINLINTGLYSVSWNFQAGFFIIPGNSGIQNYVLLLKKCLKLIEAILPCNKQNESKSKFLAFWSRL